MKKFMYYFAFLVLLPMVGFATITAEKEYALNRMNATAQKYALGTELAKKTNTMNCKYSFAVQGGATGSSIFLLRDLTDTTSYCTIPDNAVVKQAFIDVLTAGTGGSVAVNIQTAGDLKAAASASAYTGIVAGIPVDTAATMIKLTADRTPWLAITNSAVTAGVFNVYIEYVLGD
jgi:hypothetical protein